MQDRLCRPGLMPNSRPSRVSTEGEDLLPSGAATFQTFAVWSWFERGEAGSPMGLEEKTVPRRRERGNRGPSGRWLHPDLRGGVDSGRGDPPASGLKATRVTMPPGGKGAGVLARGCIPYLHFLPHAHLPSDRSDALAIGAEGHAPDHAPVPEVVGHVAAVVISRSSRSLSDWPTRAVGRRAEGHTRDPLVCPRRVRTS